MKLNYCLLLPLVLFFCFVDIALAEEIYELRKLTEDQWLSMSTEERLTALGTASSHEPNKTFLGDFGKNSDLYKTWGYEFYEMEDKYENYAFRGYEQYNVIEERRRRWSYNEFGDRIPRMRLTNARIWREMSSGNGTSDVYNPWNYINSIGGDTGYVDGVWVAREGTDDWAISVTGAGMLRTQFTPLTLSIPNIDGMSIDFKSANNSLTLINSLVYNQRKNFEGTSKVTVGVMLRGARFRRKLGVLTLGASYANMYGIQANRDNGDNWRGTVNSNTPTPLMVAVRFLDDSPEDGTGGPVVYDVRLKINGRYREDVIPQVILDNSTLDRTTAITNKLDAQYLEPRSVARYSAPEYENISINSSVPKYVDYITMNDLIQGSNSNVIETKYNQAQAKSYYSQTDQGGKEIQVDGYETVTYIFDIAHITDHINRIEAVTTVANDYKVQTSMTYTLESVGGHDTAGNTKSWYNATYWRDAAQAAGNIRDRSNVRTIKVDFGYQVATTVYSVDAEFNYMGLKIKGEYARNSNHYMFADEKAGTGRPTTINSLEPKGTGHYFSQIDDAYYLIAEKDWNSFGFAAEVFKMGKFYKPYLDYFLDIGAGSVNVRNKTARIPLIEDNDDDDMYPDTMLLQRTQGYRLRETTDPDGVFPGNDMDNDGLADNNKNYNSIPDYDEPFMMFDVDPDEFVFGDDFNNNTIPDFREDDLKYDTPYDLDRQGYHYYLRYTPQKSINFLVGSMKTKGVGSSYRTQDDYLKLLIDYDVFTIGKMYAEYRYEKIQDNIRDPYIQVETKMKENYLMPGIRSTLGRFDRDLYYDELEYRNSVVNRLFLDSKIRAIPSVTLENHVKFEKNDQIEGSMYDMTYQSHDLLSTLAMINKIVYTKSFGNWIFSPGIKYRFFKKSRQESLLPLDHFVLRIPLVMIKYTISSDTDISLGMQGIGRLPLKYSDFVQSQNDYSQKIYTIQLQNRTRYFGYNVWAAVGMSLDQIDYDEDFREYEEYKSTTSFVKVNLGW